MEVVEFWDIFIFDTGPKRPELDIWFTIISQKPGLEDRESLLPPVALSRVGAHRPSWVGTPYARSPEPRTSPEQPRDQSQHPRARSDYDEETAYAVTKKTDGFPRFCQVRILVHVHIFLGPIVPSTHFLFTILTCAHRMRVHSCPQHWLLCHLDLYLFEFEFEGHPINFGTAALKPTCLTSTGQLAPFS